MANDLATLNSKLDTQLNDTTDQGWTSGEKDDLLTWALASLYPRFSRPIDPTTTTITLVASTYFYALPAGVVAVSRLDRVGSDATEYGPVFGRAWEIVGDPILGTGKLHIGAAFNDGAAGDTLRLNGYGQYNGSTNLIPDVLVSLVLARARAEAWRRIAGQRARFKQWLAQNQTQNVSVNELIHLVNEADSEAARLEHVLPHTFQMPVSGRVG